ncbi:MAG TPA: MBL fold metallo-hydrolase, partial [Polyangiaceae bacterium]|nr:MBL fold metallo-hydrolase [Polyangiaceae bacterium]
MRRWRWVLGAVVAVAIMLLAASFRPATLPLTPLPPFKDPVARGPDGMSLAAIRAGSMSSRAAFAFRGGAFGDERSFNMGAIYLHHPKGDLLFDTGFGRHVDDQMKQQNILVRTITKYTKGIPVADQLAAAHIDPMKLKGIVLTHAHWDHVSGLDDLRGVPVLVSQKELDFIH